MIDVAVNKIKLRIIVEDGKNIEIKQIDMKEEKLTQEMVFQKVTQQVQWTMEMQKNHFEEKNQQVMKMINENNNQMKQAFDKNFDKLIMAIENKVRQEIMAKEKQRMLSNGVHDKENETKIKKKEKKSKKDKKIKKDKKKKKSKSHKKKGKKQRKKQKKREKKQRKRRQRQLGIHEVQISSDSDKIQQIPPPQINLLHSEPEMNINELTKHLKKERQKERKKIYDEVRLEPSKYDSIFSVGRLRSRGPDDGEIYVPPEQPPLYIEPVVKTKKAKIPRNKGQPKPKKQKKSKLNPLIPALNKEDSIDDQQKQQDLKQFNQRLKVLRKKQQQQEKGNQLHKTKINRITGGNIEEVPPLEYVDQFNPKYNGISMYKSYVSVNTAQQVQAANIFFGAVDPATFPKNTAQIESAQFKKIPIIFMQNIPTYSNFIVEANKVLKNTGRGYRQMVFDYPIQNTGKYMLTMRILQTKRAYIWYGAIDIRQKDRQESHNQKNTITYSLRTGHVVTSNRWGKQQTGQLKAGLAVRMEINMDKSSISWYVSDGRVAIAPISKLMRKLTLVPYFEMMETGDEVMFQE